MDPTSRLRFISVLLFLLALNESSAILVREVDQINLESTGHILPSAKQSMRIKEHIRAIRHLYPVVANVHHDPAWVPGEVVVRRNEINANIGVIKAINESQYGPLRPVVSAAGSDDDLNEVVLSFERPYHGVILSQKIGQEYNITSRPNYVSYDARSQVSYVVSAPTYLTYMVRKGWRVDGDEKVYSHTWVFTVAPSDTITVTLENESGDDLH